MKSDCTARCRFLRYHKKKLGGRGVQTPIPSRVQVNDLTLRSNVKLVVTTDLFVTIKTNTIKKQVSYDIHTALKPYTIIF